MRICATGTDGYVGAHLTALARDTLPLGRGSGDVTTLGPRIEDARPNAVIHLAAMSSIADCAADPDEARRVNVEGTRAVARAASAVGARFVFVSTDQVFDGTSPPYRESDAPTPISLYGETKAEAEAIVRDEGGENVLVVRLHLVVGPSARPDRPSGTDRLVEAVRRGESPRLFVDEFRSAIHVGDVARTLIALAGHRRTGVLHLGGPERLSRLEIGRIVVAAAGLDPDRILPGSLRDYAGPPRTPDTTFDVSLLRRTLATPVRSLAAAFTPGSTG